MYYQRFICRNCTVRFGKMVTQEQETNKWIRCPRCMSPNLRREEEQFVGGAGDTCSPPRPAVGQQSG